MQSNSKLHLKPILSICGGGGGDEELHVSQDEVLTPIGKETVFTQLFPMLSC